MEEGKKLIVKKLRPYLYLLDENHECTGFLVIGEKKACLIDTMMGYHDYKKVIADITDKPVIVINTHGHPDHIYGNVYFDEAYINPKDIPLTKDALFAVYDEANKNASIVKSEDSEVKQ